jgi:methyl coenzyme M reductase subunit D
MTNDQVLSEANTYIKLINKIRQFKGLVICGEEMENVVTTGNIQGKRDISRQRERSWIVCVDDWV